MMAVDVFKSMVSCGDPNECWIWEGGKDCRGYGRFMVDGVRHKAHRFSYELHNGPLGQLYCCHHCDNPSCVNPGHLFAGTAKDNIHDCMRKGRFLKAAGENNGRSKLTELQVKEIASTSGSAAKIGRKYGISDVMVLNIRKQRFWKHLWNPEASNA